MAGKVPHLMTLADLSVAQITRALIHSHYQKHICAPWLTPLTKPSDAKNAPNAKRLRMPSQSLFNKSIALLFSKRSTRTRLAAETATVLLGGRALFLGKDDIQLGVNESVRDSARVIGGMCQGIFARVGEHEEIEELAKYSPVPVLNALSSLWHPTQILADLLTLHEHAHLFPFPSVPDAFQSDADSDASETPADTSTPQPSLSQLLFPPKKNSRSKVSTLAPLPPLTIAWLGDSTNILHDMLVTYPRLGHKLRVATPDKPEYRCPPPVWERVKELKCDEHIWWGSDPREAVKGADVVVTDTWISMGQEAQKAQRLADFQGYQVTEELCKEGGANPNWVFLHCLPRKAEEVDDEVFYGPRSLVFPESDNRKWTTMAVFDLLFGKWELHPDSPSEPPSNMSEE